MPSATPETEHLPDQPVELEKRMVEVRGLISDMGYEIDAGKAMAGYMMGGGVFLLLLGTLAAYDLLNGKAGIYQPLGITREMLRWIAWGCGGIGTAAILQTLMRRRRRDRTREIELARLEEEYSRLKERQEMLSHKE
ncbi:MAG: hypothetical protein V7641_2544 [Blastocatellia bacterium]